MRNIIVESFTASTPPADVATAMTPGTELTARAGIESQPIPSEGWRVVLYSKTGTAHVTTIIPAALPDSSGVAVEGLIQQIVNGLVVVLKGPFKTGANALAITKLEEARHWLLARQDEEGPANG